MPTKTLVPDLPSLNRRLGRFPIAPFVRARRKRSLRYVLIFMLLPLLVGCNFLTDEESGPQPDLLTPLPSDWQVVALNGNRWQTVNIDGDPEEEFLLVYTYNNTSTDQQDGPTGISIFDLQNNTELSNLPDQPSPTYRAYRILPNYWKGSDSGYIAEPGMEDSVTIATVKRVVNEHRTELPDNATPFINGTPAVSSQSMLEDLNQELMIRGGATTLTFAWWRNMRDGYGVASVHAPAGFRNFVYSRENAGLPPDAMDGLHPQQDRSLICTVMRYTRTSMENAVYDIYYAPSLRGLYFCESPTPPAKPFYPEAVVLAYLVSVRSGASLGTWTDFPDPDAAAAYRSLFTAEARPDPDDPEAVAAATWAENWLVYGLFGPETLPYRGSQIDYTATVCAELLDPESLTMRAYRFVLAHSFPEYAQERTDEWRITDIAEIPRPENGPVPDCSDIVRPGTPGRVNQP